MRRYVGQIVVMACLVFVCAFLTVSVKAWAAEFAMQETLENVRGSIIIFAGIVIVAIVAVIYTKNKHKMI